jgi:phosphoenolpyruvate synthase/pyruvate phosphate dikinase
MAKITQKAQAKVPVSKKVAFSFGEKGPDSKKDLGGKGAGLVELVALGARVPCGFTITTAVARAYAQEGVMPKRVLFHLRQQVAALEKATGKRFGAEVKVGTQPLPLPLIVSVRSGAEVSMPGMMDTVLNLGLNWAATKALGLTVDARFAWDSYQRFLNMFGEVVLGINKELFDNIKNRLLARHGVDEIEQLNVAALTELCGRYLAMAEKESGKPFPHGAWEQLLMAVEAVLRSWNNPRAQEYRRLNGISGNLGTAVNIQAMVMGNRDEKSCSGVAFSRNVVTGAKGMWGEFLVRGQGEDVVAGIRKAPDIALMRQWNAEVYLELAELVAKMELHRALPVEIEFTVESGVLYILQVRDAKCTAAAAASVAVQFVWEKRWSKEAALAFVSQEAVAALKAPGFHPMYLATAIERNLIGRGISASPGAAFGKVVTTSQAAVEAAARGEKVVLVRPDTSPDDLSGMIAAVAIVTFVGGATSHAAVVARGLAKPAVVSLNLEVGQKLTEGMEISVDGSGLVLLGEVEMAEQVNKKEVNIFLKWVAQEEAKNWPKPRLNFDYVGQSERVETLIADFYLSDAMVREAQGKVLEEEAVTLRNKVHSAVAERLATYIATAIGGELSHGKAKDKCYNPELVAAEHKELNEGFAVEFNDASAWVRPIVIARLQTQTTADHLRFAELAATCFNTPVWSISYGGKKWGAIAQALVGFLNGTLSHSVFADHAFDLQHNGGSVFGKNRMVTGDRDQIHGLLESKKHARTIEELFKKFIIHDACDVYDRDDRQMASAAVVALYERGRKLSLWTSAAAKKEPTSTIVFAESLKPSALPQPGPTKPGLTALKDPHYAKSIEGAKAELHEVVDYFKKPSSHGLKIAAMGGAGSGKSQMAQAMSQKLAKSWPDDLLMIDPQNDFVDLEKGKLIDEYSGQTATSTLTGGKTLGELLKGYKDSIYNKNKEPLTFTDKPLTNHYFKGVI